MAWTLNIIRLGIWIELESGGLIYMKTLFIIFGFWLAKAVQKACNEHKK